MRLLSQADNLWEVDVVDVGVDAKKPFEDRFDNRLKLFGKWDAYTWETNVVVPI